MLTECNKCQSQSRFFIVLSIKSSIEITGGGHNCPRGICPGGNCLGIFVRV